MTSPASTHQCESESKFQELVLSLDSMENRLENGITFSFNQHWLTPADRSFAPGTVKMGRLNEHLLIFADLTDTSIGTGSFPFNFPAFQQNDAFEIFIHGEGSSVYYEFHITPSNSVMQLRFPLERPEGSAFEQYRVTERLFYSLTNISADHWQIAAILPLTQLCDSTNLPDSWSISFGRYDYSEDNPDPVISSTSPHALCKFHRRHEWAKINLFLNYRLPPRLL